MGSSKTTQKTTQKPTVTPQLQSLYDQLSQEAKGIVNTNLEANPFAYASDLTQDELNAFQMVRDNIGVGRGTLDAGVAAQLDALARSGRAPTQDELNAYMNPFTETVINRSIEKQQEDADRGFRNISSNAALTNAFGGSRQALLESELARNLNKNIGDTYYTGMKDNYDKSLATYLGQLDRLSENAGRTLQTAGLQQAYGLADAAALEGIGRTQRQRSDIDLALKGEDFLRLADEPYKDLEALGLATGAISPGSIGSNSTTVTKTQQSPLQSILGLGAMAAGAMTGGASSALMPALAGFGSGVGGGVGMGSFGASNLSNFVTNLPYFKGWGSKTGGRVPNPMELACGGKVKKYAYGGRVGNSFSQGESADVIRATQNPFGNEAQINRGVPANAAMPGIFNVNDTSPTPVNTTGGFYAPGNNPFESIINNNKQAWNNSEYVRNIRPYQLDKFGFATFRGAYPDVPSPETVPLSSATVPLAYNAGAVSPDMQVQPDLGGNPVASLLDQYKSGVRTNGSGLTPQANMRMMPTDAVVRPATFGGARAQDRFAEGGPVKLNNSNIPSITPVNPLSVALYFAEGGKVPNSTTPQTYAQGGNVGGGNNIMDTLFSPEGLMMLGLNILGSDASNPFQALGQAGLATLNGMEQQTVDPMEQLKLEYQMLRNQDVQARMDDRLADNSRADRQFDIRMDMAEEAADRRDARAAAGQEAAAERFERSLAAREEAAARKDIPKFKQSDYPTLAFDLREFQKLQGTPDKETGEYDYNRLDELAGNLEATAGEVLDAGFESDANRIYSVVEQYRNNREKRAQKGIKATVSHFYNLR